MSDSRGCCGLKYYSELENLTAENQHKSNLHKLLHEDQPFEKNFNFQKVLFLVDGERLQFNPLQNVFQVFLICIMKL
jgi:hypothetical protein